MILTSRCILTLAVIAASASVSHAGMTRNISFADPLLKYLESKGYQPSYGFSQSPQDDRISALLSIVGGHLSAPNPPQSSGETISGAGTLTITGNSGFSESPGLLRVNGGFGQGATTGSPHSLGSSSTTGTTQDPSTLVPEPSALLLGGITGPWRCSAAAEPREEPHCRTAECPLEFRACFAAWHCRSCSSFRSSSRPPG